LSTLIYSFYKWAGEEKYTKAFLDGFEEFIGELGSKIKKMNGHEWVPIDEVKGFLNINTDSDHFELLCKDIDNQVDYEEHSVKLGALVNWLKKTFDHEEIRKGIEKFS